MNQLERFSRNTEFKRVETGIAIFVVTSFLVQILNRMLHSFALYRLFVFAALCMLFIASRFLKFYKKDGYLFLWVPFILVASAQMLRGGFQAGAITDIFTYASSLLVLLLSGSDSGVYQKTFRIIAGFSIFYALSIFVQMFLPQVYQVFLRFLAEDTANKIVEYRRDGIFTGFSVDRGFTAGHIVAGVMVYASCFLAKKRSLSFKTVLALVVLFAAFFLTGKRGHLLALVFALLLTYLIITRGAKRILAINVVLVSVLAAIAMLLLLKDVFAAIPVLSRIADSLIGILNGEDITSGRSKLTAHAWAMFLRSPLLGIGWGAYKKTVVGTITYMTELDVHNIYLQVLCETGIVGFVTMVIPMAMLLARAIKNLNLIRRLGSDSQMKSAAIFSLAYQLFFLVYGMTGNPLYDYNYVMMYFFACSISAVIYRQLRKDVVI